MFQQAKYQRQDALRRGHVVTPLILAEVFGGFGASHATLDTSSISWPWRASRTFSPIWWLLFRAPPSSSAFHTQSSSMGLHSAVARQIAVYADYVVPSSH
eukprot:6193335-Pleurochrysis_carterae.AAC.2